MTPPSDHSAQRSLLLPDEEVRRRVVTELGTTFLVEAGAGTGKTSMLLWRLLSLVRSGCSQLERIAAITFTEKAAAELRLRLRAEIEGALAGPLSDDERHHLSEARNRLDRAQISTVHAFCATLLRERPVEARLDPTFSVLDAFSAGVLRGETWREWLAQEMDRSPEILKRALHAGITLTHLETLRDFVVEHRDCIPLLPAPVETHLVQFRATLKSAVAQLLTLKGACIDSTDRAFAQIAALAELLPTEDDNHAWERLLVRELPLSLRAGTKTHWQPTTVLDAVRTLFRQIDDAYAQTRAAWFHNLSVGLVRWLGGYLAAYQTKKQEQSSLDFVDLLLRTRDVLQQNLEVRRFFQEKFHFLLVDELQDTDPLQAEIICFLAEREPQAVDWTTVVLQPGKLFLVGDPQQSIYRFRRADPEVYAQLRAIIARQGEVLSLSTNFRTRAPVLSWINETFAREFESVGGGQPSYRPLVPAREGGSGREVILLPVSNVSPKANREELRQAEAKTVARFLTQTVTHADPTVWGDRVVRYRDIAILFRTYQAMDAYEDALREAGVPYRIFGGRRYANRQEIEELRALLRTIERPSDTTALVATLRSSVFGFSDEDLASFVSAGGRLDYTRPPLASSLPGAHRFSAAFSLLRDLHLRHLQVSPVALLYDIYARTHLMPLFALRPPGGQRVANLLQLMETAHTLAAQGLCTLAALNRFLRYQENAAEETEPAVVTEHDDALRLMTIHKAKGLEFPVVILADALYHQGRLGRTGIIERLKGSLELRVGPHDLTCTTQGWQKAEARERVRDAAEERRLWYVAATRVRDHVVVPVSLDAKGHARAEHWAIGYRNFLLAGDNETGIEPSQAGNKIFIYRSNVRSSDKPIPAQSTVTAFTRIAPNPAAVRAYQEWAGRRQEILTRGNRPEMITGVSALAGAVVSEEEAAGQGSPAPPEQIRSSVTRVIQAIFKGVSESAATRLMRCQESRGWHDIEHEQAERLVRNLIAAPILTRAQIASERFVGMPFAFHHQGRLYEGAIDLAFVEEGAWRIVDCKTEQIVGKREAEARALIYRPQLCVCGLALERLTGRRVRDLTLFFACVPHQVTWVWGENERRLAEAVLARASGTAGSNP